MGYPPDSDLMPPRLLARRRLGCNHRLRGRGARRDLVPRLCLVPNLGAPTWCRVPTWCGAPTRHVLRVPSVPRPAASPTCRVTDLPRAPICRVLVARARACGARPHAIHHSGTRTSGTPPRAVLESHHLLMLGRRLVPSTLDALQSCKASSTSVRAGDHRGTAPSHHCVLYGREHGRWASFHVSADD